MNPVAQILEQGRTVNGDNSIAQAYLQGQQTSLSRRRLDQADREQALQEQEQAVMLPLKIAQLKQESELKSLSFQTQWQQHQALLDGGKDAANAFSKISGLARSGAPPEEMSAVYADFLTANPLLGESAPAKALENMLSNYGRAKLLKENIDQRRETAEQASMDRLAAVAQRAEAAQLRADGSSEDSTAAQKNLKTIRDLKTAITAEHDPSKRADLQGELVRFERMANSDEKPLAPPDYNDFVNSKTITEEIDRLRTVKKDNKSLAKRYEGLTDVEVENMAIGNLQRAFDKTLERFKSVEETLRPRAGETVPAPARATPVASYVPGRGFVRGVANTPGVAATATPASPAFTRADYDLAAGDLRARGYTDVEIEGIATSAERDPNGMGAKLLREAWQAGLTNAR